MSIFRQLQPLFAPKHYKLQLNLNRVARQFSGQVEITGTLKKDAQEIILHAKKLNIGSVLIDDQPANASSADFDELKIDANQALTAGDHKIIIDFSGDITDPMNGLYPCYFKLDGQDEELLATQFESHHAREVFPCVDEPAAKATFDLSLKTENNITVIGNTPIKSQTKTDNHLTTTFQTTPVMSPYLLAFVAGKLDYKQTVTKAGVVVRAYSTPDKIEQTGFALDVASKTLDFYNDYFGIDYPLTKCDMIALPDFSSGAMENWGCITYRESCLLVDESHTSPQTKQQVAMTVAHELAHQWFGNLVTMQWWDGLWLNESFANWIEYLACDHIFPEWKMWTQFFDTEVSGALARDSLAGVQRVQQKVNTPEEIRTLFDPEIVYAKGAALLHMLNGYLGSDGFRDGLRLYLKRHKYGNTSADDLWEALSAATNKDTKSFMTPWTTQQGHPVVTVDIMDDVVKLHQKRFFSSPKQNQAPNADHWPVPLLCDSLKTDLLEDNVASMPLINTGSPLLLNKNHEGFYLTSYDQNHIKKLAAKIEAGELDLLDRQGLLNDNYDLAAVGVISTVQLLKLLKAYKNETSYPVWGAIVDSIGAIKLLINEDPELKPHAKRFVQKIAQQRFEQLGWDPKPNEDYFDTLLRPSIIGLMCYAKDPTVIAEAINRFDKAAAITDIRADIWGIVLSTAAKYGDATTYNKLMSWYKTATASQRGAIAAGVSGFRDPKIIAQALKLLTTKEIKLQDLFYWFVYLSRGFYSRVQTWDWMVNNWAWIKQNFESDMHYGEYPRYTGNAFSTPAELAKYKAFFDPMLSDSSLSREIELGKESIESHIAWRERDLASITKYLKDQA